MWLLLLACAHRAPDPGTSAPEIDAAPTAAPAAPAAPPAPAAPATANTPAAPPLLPPPAVVGTDVRALTNAWRTRHNEGVALLGAGDAAGAVAAAKAALALAPAEGRREPLLLVAVAASQARDVPLELEALAELVGAPDVPWAVFYNGSLSATGAGRPDLAGRYALEAFDRTDDLATVGPIALRATLAAGDLDGALRVAGRLGTAADPGDVKALARALTIAGRCPDARRLVPDACS